VRTKTRRVRLKGFCHGENYGGCFGTLHLDATLDGVPTRLGSVGISIPNSHTETIEVPISPETLLKLQMARKVTATVTAEGRDNPRSDDRVKSDSVPVQEKTTTHQVVLTPDRLPCVVPNKLVGKSAKTAAKSIKKAGCKTSVKYTKTKKAKESGRVLAVSHAPSTVLAAGAKVTITVGRRK
jgi:hypothetical protein